MGTQLQKTPQGRGCCCRCSKRHPAPPLAAFPLPGETQRPAKPPSTAPAPRKAAAPHPHPASRAQCKPIFFKKKTLKFKAGLETLRLFLGFRFRFAVLRVIRAGKGWGGSLSFNFGHSSPAAGMGVGGVSLCQSRVAHCLKNIASLENFGPPSTRSAKKGLSILQIIGLCGSVVFCGRSSVVSKAILCTSNTE